MGLGRDGVKEECPYYERGFCKLSWYECPFLHNMDVGLNTNICTNYIIGFCPKGPECELVHLKGLGVIADSDTTLKILANFPDKENWSDRNAIQL